MPLDYDALPGGRVTNAGETKRCPRCGNRFTCMHQASVSCDCYNIDLPDTLTEQLSRHYDDCLCLGCLQQLLQLHQIKA